MGILLSGYVPLHHYDLLAFMLTIVFILVVLHRLSFKHLNSALVFGFLHITVFVALGIFVKKLQEPASQPTHYSHTIESHKQQLLFEVRDVLKSSSFQDKYIVAVHQLDKKQTTGKLLLNVYRDTPNHIPLQVGQWYLLHTVLEDLPSTRYPYQFDYGQYLRQRQVYHQLRVTPQEVVRHHRYSNTVLSWASRFRESVINRLHRYDFSTDQLAIMKALLLGQRADITTAVQQQYAAAGLMHILAVSGLHVGIVLLILRFVLFPLKRRKWQWLRSVLIILSIWCFAFVTGASPSVLRAATMFTFMEIGSLRKESASSMDGVLVSALILLLVNPSFLYQAGFQLSYLAVLSILWIQPWLYQWYRPRYKLDKLYWGIATVTVAAQLGVLPLSIYYFHQFPGLFFISNLIVLPFLGIILGFGLLVIGLAMVWRVPDVLVQLYGHIIDLLNGYIEWVAQQEAFVLKHLTLSLEMLFLLYILIACVVFWLHKKSIINTYAVLVAVLAILVLLNWEKMHPASDQFVIFQKSRNTLMLEYTDNELHYYTSDSLLQADTDSRLLAYQNALAIQEPTREVLGSVFRFKQKNIVYINSDAFVSLPDAYIPDYIVLGASPNINLERLLAAYPKVTVIADGSNYKSDVERWRQTCTQLKLPFHSTYEKGAYCIE